LTRNLEYFCGQQSASNFRTASEDDLDKGELVGLSRGSGHRRLLRGVVPRLGHLYQTGGQPHPQVHPHGGLRWRLRMEELLQKSPREVERIAKGLQTRQS